MSRIGRVPVIITKEIKVIIKENLITVSGSKGELSYSFQPGIKVELKDLSIVVGRDNDTKQLLALHGLTRALINNMVEGVTKGFKKELEILGVGYKAQMKGSDILTMQLGFSHPVDVKVWKELKVTTPAPTKVTIEGIDKQRVGEFAAQIRRILPPEPYKGKGIRYKDEEVRKKLGKAMAK